MFDDRGSDQVAADIEQVIERRDRQADVPSQPGAELTLMRGDRRGTLCRFGLIEPGMWQQAPERNRLPVARRSLGRRPEREALAPEATVYAAASLATAAAFRGRAQGHPIFSGLTQAGMRDTLGSLKQFFGPSLGP